MLIYIQVIDKERFADYHVECNHTDLVRPKSNYEQSYTKLKENIEKLLKTK